MEEELENLEKKQALYTIKEVEKITGLSKDTIRNWCKDFNIQLEKTEGGHRRFSEENIQVLKSVEEKKEVNGWSMKQIGAWLGGELIPEALANTEVKTNLEKKFESLEGTISGDIEELKKVVLALTKKMDERERTHHQELLEQEVRIVDRLTERLADPVERRALEISNLMNQSIEQKQLEVAAGKEKEEANQELHKQNKELGPISRFFSRFGL